MAAISEAVEFFGEIKAAAFHLGCTERGLHIKMRNYGMKGNRDLRRKENQLQEARA